MGSRTLPLEFGPQQHAVQFRLTPQLKQALLDAAARGERTSIRVSEGTGVSSLHHRTKGAPVKGSLMNRGQIEKRPNVVLTLFNVALSIS